MEMTVSLKENSYPIYIEKGILNQADKYIKEIYQGNKIMIISNQLIDIGVFFIMIVSVFGGLVWLAVFDDCEKDYIKLIVKNIFSKIRK